MWEKAKSHHSSSGSSGNGVVTEIQFMLPHLTIEFKG